MRCDDPHLHVISEKHHAILAHHTGMVQGNLTGIVAGEAYCSSLISTEGSRAHSECNRHSSTSVEYATLARCQARPRHNHPCSRGSLHRGHVATPPPLPLAKSESDCLFWTHEQGVSPLVASGDARASLAQDNRRDARVRAQKSPEVPHHRSSTVSPPPLTSPPPSQLTPRPTPLAQRAPHPHSSPLSAAPTPHLPSDTPPLRPCLSR